MKLRDILKRLNKQQSGQVFILALIILAVGSVLLAPLMNYMGSGLVAGQIFERKSLALYAADSGIENAIWQIQNEGVGIEGFTAGGYPVAGLPPYFVDVDGQTQGPLDEVTYPGGEVNGFVLNINLQKLSGGFYRVISNALANNEIVTSVNSFIRDTTIEVTGDFSSITENVITSQGTYTIQGGQSEVNPEPGEPNGPVSNYTGDWPTSQQLASLYYEDVEHVTPFPYSSVDVRDYSSIGLGPLYRDGTFNIYNSQAGHTLVLHDTLYITGDTIIGDTNQNFTLDLNGQTIFVESATAGNQYALRIGGRVTLTGSGCIIAVGNIEFKPNVLAGPDDYVLVLSIAGKTYMQPNGDFYGTLAGSTEVHLQNGSITWNDPKKVGVDLNFPGYITQRYFGILSYKID